MECIRKEPSVAKAMEDGSSVALGTLEEVRCCGNCMHSEPLHGSGQVRLICENRSGYRGLWYAVSGSDSCNRFRQAVDFNRFLDCARNDDMEGVRMIPLTQGKFALVDEADYADLIRHSWCVMRGGRKPGSPETFYATRTIISRTTKANRTIRMHRAIMGAGRGEVVDHINHNGLDNRRCNLRICSQAENVMNRRGLSRRTSRYKGVSLNRKSGKWVAAIRRKGQNHHLGLFDSETDAARAYNAKARELFGEFAYLNDV